MAAQRDFVTRSEEDGVQVLRDNGMEVVTEVDAAAFQAAVQPAYDRDAETYGAEMLQRIRNAQK